MKCEKVRNFLPIFAAEGLNDGEAVSVRQHLEHCDECRKSLVRTRQLQGLLSLKRYEQPDELFMRNYVSEFHRRLCLDVIQESSIWTKVREFFSWEGNGVRDWVVRFSYCAAAAVVFLSLYTAHLSMESGAPQHFTDSRDTVVMKSPNAEAESNWDKLQLASDIRSERDSVYVLDRVDYKTTSHAPHVLSF